MKDITQLFINLAYDGIGGLHSLMGDFGIIDGLYPDYSTAFKENEQIFTL